VRTDYHEPQVDSSTPLEVLRHQLQAARAHGEAFGPAWPGAVRVALEDVKPSLKREWRECFEHTRSTWERCFNREVATAAEVALINAGALLDRVPLPDQWCEQCEKPLGAEAIGAYCSRGCTREASKVLAVPEVGSYRGPMQQPQLPAAA